MQRARPADTPAGDRRQRQRNDVQAATASPDWEALRGKRRLHKSPGLSERGRWSRRGDGIPVLVTLHPSALLRGEPERRDADYRAWLADLAQATRPAGEG